jgi:hypothetical protein
MANTKLKTGDKVKINIDKYLRQKDSLTETFWKFLEDNKNNILTIKEHGKWNVLWEIEEDPRWLLFGEYLVKI